MLTFAGPLAAAIVGVPEMAGAVVAPNQVQTITTITTDVVISDALIVV